MITKIDDDKVRNRLYSMMFLTLGKFHMSDWNELHTEYLYKDKMFLNTIWSKYGWLHFKFTDAIKADNELTLAFETFLSMLVEFDTEEAAVILDEFRVH